MFVNFWKKSLVALVLSINGIACSISCTACIEDTGPVVICNTIDDKCPDDKEVQRLLHVFDTCNSFDTTRNLTIYWYDKDKQWLFDDGTVAIGYTELSNTAVHVTNYPVLAHELMHVKFGRDKFNQDANHAHPPGPWEPITDFNIEFTVDRFYLHEECHEPL